MEQTIEKAGNGLQYEKKGDYYLPCLECPKAPVIGKFGSMHHQYLQSHHKGVYDGMLLNGTLNSYLEVIDREANEMLARLVVQMARKEGVTEALKARDQMAWIGAMNSIRSRAEEIVLNDLIYV